jgi:sigma-54 dependent transcriptional regulator, acetoin dehydrogenase operon transcriptional activator AcoR
LIAATHRNLRDDVAQGKFRMDLFYRIAVTNVNIPPLRERKDDMPGLIAYWLNHLCERYGLPTAAFDDDAHARLAHYDWPGNVRELRNVIESALLMAQGSSVIASDHLPPEILDAVNPVAQTPPASANAKICSLEAAESELLRNALAHSGGNMTRAASQLGIAKSTLYQKVRKYGLDHALSETRDKAQ